MKELKTFEDFEDSLKRRSVPEFDENLLIKRIHTEKSKRAVRFKIKTVIMVTALFILMISSIVYGKNLFKPVVKLYNIISSTSLSDEEGKTAFEYQKVEYNDDESSENDKLRSIYKEYSYTMYKHKKELKDNELELFIVVDAYTINGSFRLLNNDTRYTSLSELIKNSSSQFIIPTILPDKYHFKYGCIKRGDAINNNLGAIADELYNKAIKEGKDYITQKFETTCKVTEIILNYAENNGHNDIEIYINRNYKEFGGDSIQVELIDINGHEALYKTYENSILSEITFVDNNGIENLTYTVRFQSSTHLYKDMYPHIIKMIESMLE